MKIFFKMITLSLVFLSFLGLSKAYAQESKADQNGPNVLVTIKPFYAWVSAVMQGVGKPNLLIKGAESVHNYSLKPSDAKAITNADVIFIGSKNLEVYLQKPLETLAKKAEIVELANAKGITLLKPREGGLFEKDDDGDEGGVTSDGQQIPDLHFWLDPNNAIAATKEIANILSKKDPNHASLYQKNAVNYIQSLKGLTRKIEKKLANHKNLQFIVFHDAYHYFENRFHLNALGSITIDPERQPGVKRIKEIRDKIMHTKAVCVFSEPQFKPAIVQVLIEGTKAKAGVLDPLGADLKANKGMYQKLLLNLTNSLIQCDEKSN